MKRYGGLVAELLAKKQREMSKGRCTLISNRPVEQPQSLVKAVATEVPSLKPSDISPK